MEPTQDLALLADELARQQIAVHALGVDLEYVYDEIVEIDTAALEVDIELVAAAVVEAADDLSDGWFVEADALMASEEHVAYAEPTATHAHPMRFVVVVSCLLLAVAACVGATV